MAMVCAPSISRWQAVCTYLRVQDGKHGVDQRVEEVDDRAYEQHLARKEAPLVAHHCLDGGRPECLCVCVCVCACRCA